MRVSYPLPANSNERFFAAALFFAEIGVELAFEVVLQVDGGFVGFAVPQDALLVFQGQAAIGAVFLAGAVATHFQLDLEQELRGGLEHVLDFEVFDDQFLGAQLGISVMRAALL
jgi:hypothetical protein